MSISLRQEMSVRVTWASPHALKVLELGSPPCAGGMCGWGGWLPADGCAACPATAYNAVLSEATLLAWAAALPHEPRAHALFCWHFPGILQSVRCLLFGVLFPINSRSCLAAGKLPLLFDLNSVGLPMIFLKAECPAWHMKVE